MSNIISYKTFAFEESPEFKGNPTAVTFDRDVNDNRIATTNFVHSVINGKISDFNTKVNELSAFFKDKDYVISSEYKYNTDNNNTRLTGWFRLYKSGWCEQGGYSNTNEINFYKDYESEKSCLVFLKKHGATALPKILSVTSNSVSLYSKDNKYSFFWSAVGETKTDSSQE